MSMDDVITRAIPFMRSRAAPALTRARAQGDLHRTPARTHDCVYDRTFRRDVHRVRRARAARAPARRAPRDDHHGE